MIYYCDAILAGRNDLASVANGGQRTLWSGNIEPDNKWILLKNYIPVIID